MRISERPGLLELRAGGLYCPAGDFWIDPWRRAERAVITHAHTDHARPGMGRYVCAEPGVGLLRARVGADARVDGVPYGVVKNVNGVRVSLHPAGHVLGSAQVRLELDGEVAVVSGDYKTEPDPTCDPFEPLRCHTFVTESTFGLPIYRWPAPGVVAGQIADWWRANQAAGRCSLLMGYALGKSQRLLGMLDPAQGPIFIHGALAVPTAAYREAGIALPETHLVADAEKATDWSQAIVLAPPSAEGTTWLRRFGDVSTAFASGWMAVRGVRRRRALDRGFVVSDHVDWPSLLWAIRETGASRVWVTHGYTDVVVRHLQEQGLWSQALVTKFEGETASEDALNEGD